MDGDVNQCPGNQCLVELQDSRGLVNQPQFGAEVEAQNRGAHQRKEGSNGGTTPHDGRRQPPDGDPYGEAMQNHRESERCVRAVGFDRRQSCPVQSGVGYQPREPEQQPPSVQALPCVADQVFQQQQREKTAQQAGDDGEVPLFDGRCKEVQIDETCDRYQHETVEGAGERRAALQPLQNYGSKSKCHQREKQVIHGQAFRPGLTAGPDAIRPPSIARGVAGEPSRALLRRTRCGMALLGNRERNGFFEP